MKNDTRTLPELFSDALDQFSKLIRNEVQLARAELSAKASEAMTGIGLLVGGAVLLIPALVLLLMALAAWLVDMGLAPATGDLLAGVLGLIVSAILGWVGMHRLNPSNLTPRRTLEQLQRDTAAAKEI
jgi:uncharacterized membrane protein YqjE